MKEKLKKTVFSGFIATIFLITASIPSWASLSDSTEILNKNATVAGKKIEENKEEIIKIREEVKKKVEEKIKEVISRKSRRGWRGIIKEKTAASIKLETRKGEREVLYDEETTIINERRQKTTDKALVVGKEIIAMGYPQSENLLESKRIVLLPKTTPKPSKIPLLGIISDKSQEEKLLAVTPIKNKNQLIELTITFKTKILGKDGKKATYNDFEKGQKIVAVYQKEEKENKTLIIKIITSPPKTTSTNKTSPTPTPTP